MPSGVNYEETFIAVADDCPVDAGTEPSEGRGGAPTTATIQFQMLVDEPYRWTSEDLIFRGAKAGRELADAPPAELADAQATYFSRPQACLRASPLPKRWGWGLHFDVDGRVALYAKGTADYDRLAGDGSLEQLKAMRSSRA